MLKTLKRELQNMTLLLRESALMTKRVAKYDILEYNTTYERI